jgi:opacity protein-like surface antigen
MQKERSMKRIIALVLGLFLPVSAVAAADSSQQVTDAAKGWLSLIDGGQYDQSWNEASKLFQSHVTDAQWTAQVKTVRDSLGPVETRNAPTVRFATSLPGVPDGQYAMLQFHTKFAHKADAIETITMAMDDGTWKLAGYFIK